MVADTATRSTGGNVDPGRWKEIQVHNFATSDEFGDLLAHIFESFSL